MPRRFLHRHQPPSSQAGLLKAGLGGTLGIAGVGLLGELVAMPLLMAPLGATSVLLFAVPDSPLSQPANVIGGHLVAALLGLALHAFLPNTWWAAGVAVGVVIAATILMRVTHPPAGADPLVLFLGGPPPDAFLASVALGSVFLIATALVVHRLPPRTVYPIPPRPRRA